MEIRVADRADKDEIVSLYQLSQLATGLPSPEYAPAHELGQRLYGREVLERYVALENGKIVGHGHIENPNPQHIPKWQTALNEEGQILMELGGAFVHPESSRHGIWTALLKARLERTRRLGAVPVSATWVQNSHVINKFVALGGQSAGYDDVIGGRVALFVFN